LSAQLTATKITRSFTGTGAGGLAVGDRLKVEVRAANSGTIVPSICARTKKLTWDQLLEALEKNFTVRLAAESNVTGTVALVAVLVILVLGIAIASIKISRR
jgi:hypothetical protein